MNGPLYVKVTHMIRVTLTDYKIQIIFYTDVFQKFYVNVCVKSFMRAIVK